LSSLGNYGGPTQTHALQTGSAAINAGSYAALLVNGAVLGTDQRGFARVAGAMVDIGAFEMAAPIIVSTLADELDGDYRPGDLSLREAIALAATLDGADTITFKNGILGDGQSVITLTYDGNTDLVPDELAISSDLAIVGPGADRLSISGADLSRGLSISNSDVTISGLTIEDCAGESDGIGINASNSNLTLTGLVIKDNENIGAGTAGIQAVGGSLTIVDSTIDGNTGFIYAGVTMSGGPLTIRNSTISNNSGDMIAGVIFDGSDTYDLELLNTTISGNDGVDFSGLYAFDADESAIINCTIVNNTAMWEGAGVIGEDLLLHNTIVAGNTLTEDDDSDLSGTFDSNSSHNLIGFDPDELLGGTNNNVGVLSPLGVLLGDLEDNGGPTKTHALLDGSLAIDAGDDTIASAFDLMYDQRGKNRIDDGDDDLDARVDIGAFELAADEFFASV